MDGRREGRYGGQRFGPCPPDNQNRMYHGIDLVEMARIDRLASRESFLRRIYTPHERELLVGICALRQREILAGRFAAKEATYKALQVLRSCRAANHVEAATAPAVGWHDIEVLRMPNGLPLLLLHGNAKALTLTHQVSTFQVSISHTRDLAMASVLLL